MVRALEKEQEDYRSRLSRFQDMHDNPGRHVKSLSADNSSCAGELSGDDTAMSRSYGARPHNENPAEQQQIGWSLHKSTAKVPKSRQTRDEPKDKHQPSDMDLMKERFAKLLLGEDMSGGGKGVSSALALSNAITNLAASAFGEQKRLEPMAPETRARWKKEIDWLLSVTDHIVEMVPSQQKNNGVNMEIMTTRQRTDLHMNIPALRKLDAMLIDCLDNFKDQNEFYYVKKDEKDSEKGDSKKWWLPTVKVPPNGLSEMSRKWIQFQKDSVNQVLKAAMAINAQVLSEMEIPENYIESLPKNGRASLGDSLYKHITDEYFDPDQFLCAVDMSSEHKILDLKNKIEASIIIWKRKMNNKDSKSSWGSAVSMEKRELFEERAETILLLLKQRFPGISQSSLDISKIQYNRDVGQAILESYSRILESLAFTVLSRIEDVLHADYVAQNPSQAPLKRNPLRDCPSLTGTQKFNAREEIEKLNSSEAPSSMTLLDFMGWNEQEAEEKKDTAADNLLKDSDGKHMDKLSNLRTANKKVSYLENLGGVRSPTSRH
ncbi:rop guanine nucleotide exchange factor 12-like [Rhodamnia argentea]|uniref:Rop guanine nucleotide exchange factor 12-like n=1 Tax=Rhodamnia argentea TaxID=178133 RepID=A0A8B8NXN3_9MYRT|nr:rop guanine nucleotide exchange factor 12-like [Rhodamnia argentea]